MPEARSAAGGGGHLGATLRRDAWWLELIPVVLVLGGFGVYAMLRAFEGAYYEWGPYLSPFYSPLIDPAHRWWPFSPALLILAGPLGFRVTCYYYRKAYYRSFFLSPPACAVTGPRRRRYRGEAAFPYVLMNAHRFFLYLATIVLGFLAYDAVRAFFFRGSDGSLHLGVGVGTLVLVANVVLLSMFTFGCNSLRHLVGGRLDCFTCSASAQTRHKLYRRVTFLNIRHMQWAWISLGGVALTDLYIRLASMGVFDDPRIL